MSGITTHVLDTARGEPARGIRVALEQALGEGTWAIVAVRSTDDDGRARALVPPGESIAPGSYRLVFDTGGYLTRVYGAAFFPSVTIEFAVEDGAAHYHVPLLLSPFGYSTYRGS